MQEREYGLVLPSRFVNPGMGLGPVVTTCNNPENFPGLWILYICIEERLVVGWEIEAGPIQNWWNVDTRWRGGLVSVRAELHVHDRMLTYAHSVHGCWHDTDLRGGRHFEPRGFQMSRHIYEGRGEMEEV